MVSDPVYFACCKHCEHDPECVPGKHIQECPEGCNDGDTDETAQLPD